MTQSAPKKVDHDSIKAWFDTWSRYVAAVDFDSARPMFEENVVGFGTWMDTVEGRENLIERQWQSIWPTIRDFEFLTDTLHVRLSPDRLFAVAVLVWNSTGFHENGESYPRPGRATVGIRRDSVDAPWMGVHTHLSLNRDVPQKSYGMSS
ncbi:MAG: nuclear transport factor 2 family protein [Alphaproteobacteria bacterium]|nr:nuclear transport factor 2 family protein [Alphaproteobacteria bacterium]